jgi:hypothetical protein
LPISTQHSAFSPETFRNAEKKAFTAKDAKVAKEEQGIRSLTKAGSTNKPKMFQG